MRTDGATRAGRCRGGRRRGRRRGGTGPRAPGAPGRTRNTTVAAIVRVNGPPGLPRARTAVRPSATRAAPNNIQTHQAQRIGAVPRPGRPIRNTAAGPVGDTQAPAAASESVTVWHSRPRRGRRRTRPRGRTAVTTAADARANQPLDGRSSPCDTRRRQRGPGLPLKSRESGP